jgi:hypothetical protein
MYKVKNVSKNFSNYKYAVIRKVYNDDNVLEYWWYGAYNSLILAQNAYNEIHNGLIVEAEKIEPETFDQGW